MFADGSCYLVVQRVWFAPWFARGRGLREWPFVLLVVAADACNCSVSDFCRSRGFVAGGAVGVGAGCCCWRL